MKTYILITTNPMGDGKAFGQQIANTMTEEVGKFSVALIGVLTVVLIAKSFIKS